MTEKKPKAGRIKSILALILLFAPASLLVFISTRGCEHKFKELDILGEIPAYSFQDINGKTYTNSDFKGEIVLFTNIQETCPDSCGVLMWYLDQQIYQHVRTNPKKLGHVKIVSFVTDSEGNPVKDLKDMEFILKDRVEAYDPAIWILATGDSKKLYNLERNGEKLIVEGEEYFGGESFLELMLLVDKSNKLRMVSKGNSEGMIRRMKQYMALLDKQYDKEAKKAKNNAK